MTHDLHAAAAVQQLPQDWAELELRLATYLPGGDEPTQEREWQGMGERAQLAAAIRRAAEARLAPEAFSGFGRGVGRFKIPVWLSFGDTGAVGDVVVLVSAAEISRLKRE